MKDMESLIQSLRNDLEKKDHVILEKDHVILEKDHVILEKDSVILEKEARILQLEEIIKLLNLRQFAKRSEKNIEPSGDIFNPDEAPEEPIAPKDDGETTVAAHQRKKPKRKPLPNYLPRVDVIHDLSDEEKTCSCGCLMSFITDVISEQLDIIPQVVQVLRHIRKKYACKSCDGSLKVAPMPPQPIPKSMASPGLLAHILVSKFCDHLPLYRQEQIFKRSDVDLCRGTLSQWVIRCGALVQPLINLMQEKMLEYDVGYSDETRVQVLKEKDRKAESQSFMWVFGGGRPKEFSWIFHYEPTRSGDVPLEFWEGYKGYLHVDAYAGYYPLEKQLSVLLVNCMAHARRNFTEVAKLAKKKNGVSHEVLARIGKLYLIEKKLKDAKALPDTIQQTRSEKSKPILDSLGEYLVEKQAAVLPRSALGKAIAYMLNHWIGLNRYLEDGRLEIDNNRTERCIKPFATGRKNWLFSDSVKGADSSANIYSLIETCKVHGVNPYDYLRHVLIEINKCKMIEDFEKLLPYVYNTPPAFQASPPQAVGTSF